MDRRNFLKLSGYGLLSMTCCSGASHAARRVVVGSGAYKGNMLGFIQDPEGNVFGPTVSGTDDDPGYFELTVPPATYRVNVNAPGYVGAVWDVVVTPGGEIEVDLVVV